MSILSGYKKVKNYIETGSGKKLLSRWTSSNTVECDDGKTVQTKVGAIKGITTSTSATETGYAADATTVAALNQSLGKSWEQKVNTNNRKVWVKTSNGYTEEIGTLFFSSIGLTAAFGNIFYNTAQPYGIQLATAFKTTCTINVHASCKNSILTATTTTVDLTSSPKVLKYWIGSAKSGTYDIYIMYRVVGTI